LILFKQSSVKVKAKKGVKHSNSTRVFHQFYVVLPLLLQDFVEVLLKIHSIFIAWKKWLIMQY